MTTETLEDYTAYVSTDCACYMEDEKTGEDIPADNCAGCGEWMLEGALECLDEFLERNKNTEAVNIEGQKMSWRSLSGYKVIRNTNAQRLSREILDSLTLNGDFTLQLHLKKDKLTAKRSSHDEPMGANFTISPVEICQGYSECLATEFLQELDGVKFCVWCLEIEKANR
jgi:hypothetical protein